VSGCTTPERPELARRPSPAALADGIRAADRAALARAITLVESSREADVEPAQRLLTELLPLAGRSLRVGITGVPGVGKSTFIEALGTRLCRRGRRLAVLAVDPSSSISKGSILGDKTRMEQLIQEPNAFIRPSPTGGALGGVTRKTRETILLCEAFGFDTVLVETVGVGQSETAVHSMVDCFLVLMLAGAGDELQGIKKGILELADGLVITKADGDNVRRVELAAADLRNALRLLQHSVVDWRPPVLTCSAIAGDGLDEVWEAVVDHERNMKRSGHWESRRRTQLLDWVTATAEEEVLAAFRARQDPTRRARIDRDLVAGTLAPYAAVRQIMDATQTRSAAVLSLAKSRRHGDH
jgi:LAO/AO transport system kinase